MSDASSPAPLSTAAELWRRFVREGVLRPKSYDKDVVTLLERQLSGTGALPRRMEVAGWTARDLLRAMSPVVDSFAGLMRDLLALYADIAATQATNENLTLAYEFEEGDVFDQSLEQFRHAVTTLDNAQAVRGSFVMSPERWKYPTSRKLTSYATDQRFPRQSNKYEWDFTLPTRPVTDDPVVERGVSLVYEVLEASCNLLRNYGATLDAARKQIASTDRGANCPEDLKQLYFDFTDYFPQTVISNLRADIEHLGSLTSDDARNWLREIEAWCSSFWKSEEGDAESALESVLALPMWGKRHELYSAWVVCVIAEAFEGRGIHFEVVNGRLSFPFKATKIASFGDKDGPVELWTEVRSTASGDMAHGRKGGVQPDFRFLREGQDRSETEMVVEAKQYHRAAGARHGDTARDYARALPHARVTVVAHGPIGGTAMDRVDEDDQPRVSFHENVRSLDSTESKGFMAELAEAFPAAAHVQHIELVQLVFDQVEVRLIVQEQGGGKTELRGEFIQVPDPCTEAEIVVEIVCHPDREHTIDGSCPRLAITSSDGEVRLFEAVQPNLTTRWNVGTLHAASFTMSEETVESPDPTR